MKSGILAYRELGRLVPRPFSDDIYIYIYIHITLSNGLTPPAASPKEIFVMEIAEVDCYLEGEVVPWCLGVVFGILEASGDTFGGSWRVFGRPFWYLVSSFRHFFWSWRLLGGP